MLTLDRESSNESSSKHRNFQTWAKPQEKNDSLFKRVDSNSTSWIQLTTDLTFVLWNISIPLGDFSLHSKSIEHLQAHGEMVQLLSVGVRNWPCSSWSLPWRPHLPGQRKQGGFRFEEQKRSVNFPRGFKIRRSSAVYPGHFVQRPKWQQLPQKTGSQVRLRKSIFYALQLIAIHNCSQVICHEEVLVLFRTG